ncbi:MAG: hypothetical protein J0L99_04085 [Chitinophagales bacterium]|nr:hypothetical protein [Chitinophagales bacterium]
MDSSKPKYDWVRPGLIWAAVMYIANIVVWWNTNGVFPDTNKLLVAFPISLIAGMVVGYTNKRFFSNK